MRATDIVGYIQDGAAYCVACALTQELESEEAVVDADEMCCDACGEELV